jgi:hypothetical protein
MNPNFRTSGTLLEHSARYWEVGSLGNKNPMIKKVSCPGIIHSSIHSSWLFVHSGTPEMGFSFMSDIHDLDPAHHETAHRYLSESTGRKL